MNNIKKSIVIILLFSTAIVHSQSLLIEDGKSWSVVNYPSENSHIFSYYLMLGSDTISNSISYHKLLVSYDSLKTNWSLLKLIRQDQNKVYFKNLENENEMLLYDFGVGESDSFQTYTGTKLGVDSIRSIGGKQHYYLSKGRENVHWIEGVGCTSGLLESHGGIGLVGLSTVLICCEINYLSLYHNESYSGCFFSTSVNYNKSLDLILEQNYPNPYKYSTLIKVNLQSLPNKAYLNFYSIQRSLIKRIEILNSGLNEILLDDNDLEKGIYFYNLSEGKEYSKTLKLIHN